VYLTGRVSIEGEGGLLDQAAFPGRQGRLVFGYLALQRRPVPRDELATLLWGDTPPASWEVALSAVMSKLRGVLRQAGLGAHALDAALGCYELRLPAGTWVDVEAASGVLHEAESLLRAGQSSAAWVAANVAYHITRRPFLPGDEGLWVEQQRGHLLTLRARATECFAEASLLKGEPELAVAAAEELVGYEPFRESAHQLLMRALVATGNRAEALRAFERCRQLLAEELGTDPSPETQALHLRLLTGV
jgi:DNA-binding SARP family transcriptional activator